VGLGQIADLRKLNQNIGNTKYIKRFIYEGKSKNFYIDNVCGVMPTTAQASPVTIYVPDDYSTIQATVNAANSGDTIIVNSGTYSKNVNVTKQLILRSEDTGTGKPVMDASGSGCVITLSADGITFDGFTATNSGSLTKWGIKVTSNNNTITGNTASNNNYHDNLVWSQRSHAGITQEEKSRISSQMTKLHIPFIANQGQIDEGVKYYAKT
jgi:hypothetical protein